MHLQNLQHSYIYMEKIIIFGKRVAQLRFLRYVFVGGTTFAADFTLLVVLHSVFSVPVLIAASISYWTSIVFNFLANRAWTFESKETQNIAKHIVLYLTLLGLNFLFTIGTIALLTHFGIHYTIAKIVATAIQTVWTYFAYKKIIFK